MKAIKENKFLIYDRPVKLSMKHCVKFFLFIILSFFYKFIMRVSSFFKKGMNDEKKYNVAICAIFRNEAKFLTEWIEFHKIVGVEHFYLYNNFSDDNYEEILKPYVLSGEVELIEWPVKQGQMSAYADCVKKYKNEARWIGFIDLDEFVVPVEKNNLYEELIKYESYAPTVLIYWRMFGTSGLIERDKGNFITEDFVVAWKKHTNIGKCFVNTNFDIEIPSKRNKDMHTMWGRIGGVEVPPVNLSGKVCFSGFNPTNQHGLDVQINHYFTKSYREYLEKVSRGDAFFEINPRDEEYFYRHEMGATTYDCTAYKFLVKLKRRFLEINKEE